MLSSGCHAYIVLNGVIIEAVSTEIRGHIAGTACRIGGHGVAVVRGQTPAPTCVIQTSFLTTILGVPSRSKGEFWPSEQGTHVEQRCLFPTLVGRVSDVSGMVGWRKEWRYPSLLSLGCAD